MRIVLSLLLGLVLPQAADAHARLKSASPAAGAVVVSPPAELTIEYSEAPKLSSSTFEVRDAAGVRVDRQTVQVSPGNTNRVIVPLKPLPPGGYTVTWHVTAAWDHRTQGAWSFQVRP